MDNNVTKTHNKTNEKKWYLKRDKGGGSEVGIGGKWLHRRVATEAAEEEGRDRVCSDGVRRE